MADQKIIDYVKAQMAKGKTVEDIRGALLAQGWNEKDIAEAISSVAAVPIPSVPGPIKRDRKKLKIAVAAIGIILILVAVIGIVFPGLLF